MAYGNSANTHLQRDMVARADMIHAVPDGISLPPGSEQIWDYMMKSRHFDDWYESDLIIAAKIVRYEVALRQGYARLDAMMADGADLFDVESYASSYINQIGKVERAQLALIRGLGFTRASISSEGAVKRAANQKEFLNVAALITDATGGSMLAQ